MSPSRFGLSVPGLGTRWWRGGRQGSVHRSRDGRGRPELWASKDRNPTCSGPPFIQHRTKEQTRGSSSFDDKASSKGQ